jgi:hypothetical protein
MCSKKSGGICCNSSKGNFMPATSFYEQVCIPVVLLFSSSVECNGETVCPGSISGKGFP